MAESFAIHFCKEAYIRVWSIGLPNSAHVYHRVHHARVFHIRELPNVIDKKQRNMADRNVPLRFNSRNLQSFLAGLQSLVDAQLVSRVRKFVIYLGEQIFDYPSARRSVSTKYIFSDVLLPHHPRPLLQ